MFVSTPSRSVLVLGLLVSSAALTGCVGSLPVKSALDKDVRLVQESSDEISIHQSKLVTSEDGWRLQGRLTRKQRNRGFSPGHLDLVVSDKQGRILEKQQRDLEYMTDDIFNPFSGRYSSFEFNLNQPLAELGEIRISHHDSSPNHD